MAVLREDDAGLIRSATLFDVYKRAPSSTGTFDGGERSLAVRLELLDDNNTLTDERIDSCIQAALSRAAQAFGARLRT
jgi:phenylalanyl-tRNA synthetase beta chain